MDKLPRPDAEEQSALERVAGELAERALSALRPGMAGFPLPSRSRSILALRQLRTALFPGYFGRSDVAASELKSYVQSILGESLQIFREEIWHGLCFMSGQPGCEQTMLEQAGAIIENFTLRLPELRRLLELDAIALYEGDPASRIPEEPVFSYPGFIAILSQRAAHELQLLGAPLIPRIITEYAHSRTGIDIHPGARIGESFFIDHGTGVVIGETTVIGKRVKIYQGVTLGARSFPVDSEGHPLKGIARHPIVEDDVTIYAGATVLGRVTIGAGSVIGGNVWITRDLAPGSRVYQGNAGGE